MGKRFKAEEIVMKLREAEILISKGMDDISASHLLSKVIIAGEKSTVA